MSTFTMPLKSVIEATGGTVEVVNGISVITDGDIGLENYVIFDEAHRPMLNGMIIDHYWNREIGMETIPMFQLAVRRRMNEIMPVYNKLFESTLLEFDPLKTVDLSTVNNGTTHQVSNNTAVGTGESSNASQSRSVTSDTPQNMLRGNADYASGAADVNGTGTATNNSTEESDLISDIDTDNTSTTSGYQGVVSDLVMRYRESLINVDLMIIRELEDCFMLVWDNGDSYFSTSRGYLL